MSYSTPLVDYEYKSNDSDDTDDTEELVHEAHWQPDVRGAMSVPPRTNIGNVVTEMCCVHNELVSSLEQVGPAMEAIHDATRTRTSVSVALQNLMLAQTQILTVQTQVLNQLSDKLAGYDTLFMLLEEHQKQSENQEALLKKLEALHDLNSPTSTPRNGEANATASAPRQAPTLILESAPVPMPTPTPNSARAPGVRVRELTGWSKLSVQARGLLRESALARLHHKQNVFSGALGTHSQNVMTWFLRLIHTSTVTRSKQKVEII